MYKSMKWMSAFMLMSLLVCCSRAENDMEEAFLVKEKGVFGYINPIIEDDASETRATVDPDAKWKYSWVVGDRINIWSEEGTLLFYTVKKVTDQGMAKFDGGGFSLMDGDTYYSSYPLIKTFEDGYMSWTTTYTGQKQTENNNSQHLSNYLYTFATATCEDGTTVFNYDYQNSFFRFVITVPKAMTLTELTITATEPIFSLDGTVDIKTNSFTPGTKSDVMTLALDNIEISESDKVLKAFMCIAPCDAGEYVVRVKDSEGKIYSSPVISKPARLPGKAAAFTTEVFEGENPVVCKIGNVSYETVSEAISAAKDGDVLELLADYDATAENMMGGTRQFVIDKNITIDGKNHSIITKERGFGVGNVNGNLTDNINVTFKDITILNASSGARCIDTRGKIGSLTLDNVTLSTDGAPSGYTQPLTIGGNQADAATINITNSTIQTNDAGTAYYAIITFNPVNMTVTGSTLKGWACVYAKGKDSSAGSAGSVIGIDDCTIISTNVYNGTSNAFAAFVAEDDNVTVNVTNSEVQINANGDQYQAISSSKFSTGGVFFGDGNNTVLSGDMAAYKINESNLRISGGIFNVPVPEYCCAEGFVPKDLGDGTYTVQKAVVAQIGDVTYETIADAVAAAKEGQTIEVLKADEYTLPNLPENVTVEGAVDGVVFNHTTAGSVASVPNGATFKNVTFNFGNVDYHGFQHAGTINMEDCTLNGRLTSYGNMNFTNCTFEQSNKDYHMWVYGGGTVNYTDCTFNGLGKFLNLYQENGSAEHVVNVENSTFNSSTKNKAALNVKATCGSTLLRYDVNITNCTTNENFPEASTTTTGTLVVLNGLVQVDDRTADGVDNITVTQDGQKIYPVLTAQAKIGDVSYETFEAAFAAAKDGDTITLLADCAGNGIKADQGKFTTTGLTVDFGGHTYTMDGAMVGSTGTETQAFQLLKDNKITFKNGTITSEKAKILVQNYSDLRLEGMTLSLNNSGYTSAYTLSNNNGNVVIDGSTITANPAGGFAFDVCRYASYPSVHVTVKGASEINGNVEVYASGNDAKDGFSLMIEAGTLNGQIVLDQTAKNAMAATPDKAKVSKTTSLGISAPEGYEWVNNGDGTSHLAIPVTFLEIETGVFADGNGNYKVDGTSTDGIRKALSHADENSIANPIVKLVDNVSIDIQAWQSGALGGTAMETITIDGDGHTLAINMTNSDWNNIVTNGAKLIIQNASFSCTSTGNGAWNNHGLTFKCDVELENVNADRSMVFGGGDVMLKNVSIIETGEFYSIMVRPDCEKTVTVDHCSIVATNAGRGIKIIDQYIDVNKRKPVVINVSNTSFTTAKKAAILSSTTAGATINWGSGNNIENVAADKVNAFWCDNGKDSEGTPWSNYFPDLFTLNGCTGIIEP